MKSLTNYDDIGRAAMDYFLLDIERFNARKQRQIARQSHVCDNEVIKGDGDPEPMPCYETGWVIEDWCVNCRYVQPFYLKYKEAAKKCGAAKGKLTRLCKEKQWNDAN